MRPLSLRRYLTTTTVSVVPDPHPELASLVNRTTLFGDPGAVPYLVVWLDRRCQADAGEFRYSNIRRRVNNEGRLLSICTPR